MIINFSLILINYVYDVKTINDANIITILSAFKFRRAKVNKAIFYFATVPKT